MGGGGGGGGNISALGKLVLIKIKHAKFGQLCGRGGGEGGGGGGILRVKREHTR